MSEKKLSISTSNHIVQMFSGLQYYEFIETHSHTDMLCNDYIYTTKLKFFMLEDEEDECQPYLQNNKSKMILYSDWTRCLQMHTFAISTTLTLTTFFLANSLDIPRPFKGIRSLMTPTSVTIFTKLTAMLMRHGRKTLIIKSLSRSLIHIVNLHSFRETNKYTSCNWRLVYQIFTTWKINNALTLKSQTTTLRLLKDLEISEFDDQYSSSLLKHSTPIHVFSNLLPLLLVQYKPIFSFYVKKVSKLKWKHSRGKSGRYTIKWKYIPLYKRLIVLLRWLVNDIQFQNHHNFYDRLFTSLKNLWVNPSSHLIIQFRRFVHKYVFQRCKNTLLLKFHSEV